jgi:hypothetical protein
MLDNNIPAGSNSKSIPFLQNSIDYISFANAYDMTSPADTDLELTLNSQLAMLNSQVTPDDYFVVFGEAASITTNLDMEQFVHNNLLSLNPF